MIPGSSELPNVQEAMERYVNGNMDEESLREQLKRHCLKASDESQKTWRWIACVGVVGAVYGIYRAQSDASMYFVVVVAGLLAVFGIWDGWLTGGKHSDVVVERMVEVAKQHRSQREAGLRKQCINDIGSKQN